MNFKSIKSVVCEFYLDTKFQFKKKVKQALMIMSHQIENINKEV
jgi:hypothetical protein